MSRFGPTNPNFMTHRHPELQRSSGQVSYDNSDSGLDAENLKDAIDELADDIAAISTPTAADVSVADGADHFSGDDVEEVLAEIATDQEADAAAIAAHIADSSAAHAASAISVTDSGGHFTGTDVETVLAEVAARFADFLTTTDYTDDVTYVADAGSAHTIEDPTANVQDITLTEANTLTFPTATDGKAFLIRLHPDGNSVTWDSDVEWPGGTPPTLSGDLHILAFLSDGTKWYGAEYGAAGSGGGASALDDLTDVTITTPATGALLRYNGSAWVDAVLTVDDYPFHDEPLTDGAGNFIFAGGDVIVAVGVPNP